MRGKISVFFIFLTVFGRFAYGQTEQWIEGLSEVNPEWPIDEEVLQLFRDLQRNPININRCSERELLAIPGMDPLMANRIINHREISGRFLSIYELQVVQGMNKELFALYRMLFSVEPSNALGVALEKKSEYLLLFHPQLQKREGYRTGRIQGPPIRQWHRFNIHLGNNWQLGLSLENDAGEQFRWNSEQKGFDFGTVFGLYHDPKQRFKLIIGDYRVVSGQGLVHGGVGGFGSAAWVGRVFRGEQARGYRSADESRFLRGFLLENNFKGVQQRVFVSHLRTDGIESQDGVSESGTGLHRTDTELAKRKVLLRSMAGHSFRIPIKNAASVSFHQLWVSENGKKNFYSGISHQWQVRNILLFGEVAYAKEGISVLQSMVISVNKNLEISALFRRYPRNNFNPLASGFSEFSKPENERGLYLSGEYRSPSKRIWRTYADWAFRPFPSYLVHTSYWKNSLFIETEEKIAFVKLRLRYQSRIGERNAPANESDWRKTLTYNSQGLRIQLEWLENKSFQFRTRLEITSYKFNNQQNTGTLFFQELQWRPKLKPYYFIFRYVRFHTPVYETRIYTYESEVLYGFAIPAFSGSGDRVYTVVRFPIYRGLDAWFKAALTLYGDREEIGSGLERIDQSWQLDTKILLRYRF